MVCVVVEEGERLCKKDVAHDNGTGDVSDTLAPHDDAAR